LNTSLHSGQDVILFLDTHLKWYTHLFALPTAVSPFPHQQRNRDNTLRLDKLTACFRQQKIFRETTGSKITADINQTLKFHVFSYVTPYVPSLKTYSGIVRTQIFSITHPYFKRNQRNNTHAGAKMVSAYTTIKAPIYTATRVSSCPGLPHMSL
jgi:hypothetical protein